MTTRGRRHPAFASLTVFLALLDGISALGSHGPTVTSVHQFYAR
jgi:hypothetical protein